MNMFTNKLRTGFSPLGRRGGFKLVQGHVLTVQLGSQLANRRRRTVSAGDFATLKLKNEASLHAYSTAPIPRTKKFPSTVI